ncbi:BlaI/MecI/CopY family transcriptional regulator [Lysobacter claricitrinus]|uniref:BlaI/MecI/CopY family transcriptional regulator n=1 Tax=Lysobacter claricitrinus TaxID=3367728 RepID=UPI0038B3A764
MSTPQPTEGELALLRVLWARKAPMTVREVHADLSKSKDTAYTTVLKMLTIMSEKGLVHRDESERSHAYTPVHPERVVQRSLVKDLMRRAFSGSAASLVQRALDDGVASEQELDEIARMIAEAKARRQAK